MISEVLLILISLAPILLLYVQLKYNSVRNKEDVGIGSHGIVTTFENSNTPNKSQKLINNNELGLYHLPSRLHKHIIGPQGAVIKNIQRLNDVQIDLFPESDSIKIININGTDEQKVLNAFTEIEKKLEQVGWFYESGVWIERLEYDEIFKKWNIKIESEAESMKRCFEDAKNSFETGKKEEAKLLSNNGKKHQENMHKYKKECSNEVFAHLNSKLGEYVIDLHGQMVNEALEFISERISVLSGRASSPLQIITGAGNHSDGGAKIKPAVIKYLLDKNLKYEEINDGSINVEV